MIITRAPFRVSFCGGGSDLPSFYEKYGGCVLSTTIRKYMYLTIHNYFEKDQIVLKYSKTEIVHDYSEIEHRIFKQCLSDFGLKGVELSSMADIPAGTGLGSSSTFTVALLQLLNTYTSQYVSKYKLAKDACAVEIEKLGEPIGKQDQFAAAFGGLKFYEFMPNGFVNVEPIIMKPESYSKLENNLMMFYLGGTHSASAILKEQSKNVQTVDKAAVQKKMCDITRTLKNELQNNNVDAMGELLHENWMLKRSLASGISNPLIDETYELAMKAGTTTVRCKMPNGTEATCNVTVKPLATSLKLNASEIVLYIGQSFDINSSVQKGTAAYYRLYSSSNSKIAAVTRGGGVVKGVATGKATVTCTLNNGKKAICNVYIMPQSKKISNVPLIGQSKLPTGCETCSATMLLNFYGYKISETTFADKYLVKKPFGYSNGSYTGPDPNCAFVGTPYSSNSYGAYAPIMAKCMNKYLSDKSYKAVEISGKSLEYLSGKYVAQGQPIMVWATINMSPSFKTTTWRVNYTDENAKYKLGSYYTWTAGEHCLLLTGYDKDYYYFNDPWTNARTRYSKSLVNTRYNELGKQAVVMVKK